MINPDFHSHIEGSPVVSVDISELQSASQPHSRGGRLTVGIHPWLTGGIDIEAAIATLESALDDPRVAAIGEVGLDTLRGAPIEVQAEILRKELIVAERHRLPVVFHIVRAWDRLLKLHDTVRPTVNWAVHGITARPSVVASLAERGIFMSAGPRTKAPTALAIPDSLLLIETDGQAGVTIGDVIKQIASMRSSDEESIKAIAYENLNRFFGEKRCQR